MPKPVLRFQDAAIEPLWRDLSFEVQPGEFLAILGANGVGKSTLLNIALGTRKLTHGSYSCTPRVGYIPQQRLFDPELPLRVRDLVGLSLAHGVLRNRRAPAEAIMAALREVGAAHLADMRIGQLSGGQQQVVRQAQALAGDPKLLLCDEPLLSLDVRAQKRVVSLLDARRRAANTAIVFVTHSINPILQVADRVLYLTNHGHTLGTIDEVMTSATLSQLYQTDITVAEVNGKLVVVP